MSKNVCDKCNKSEIFFAPLHPFNGRSFCYPCVQEIKKTEKLIPSAIKGPIKDIICKSCGHTGTKGFLGEFKNKKSGSAWVELALYFFFFIPGLIYAVWRNANKRITCPKCGGRETIPLHSPLGAKLFREINA